MQNDKDQNSYGGQCEGRTKIGHSTDKAINNIWQFIGHEVYQRNTVWVISKRDL